MSLQKHSSYIKMVILTNLQICLIGVKQVFYWLPFFLIFKEFIYIFYWSIIALQNFVLFCQTSVWISHRYTYIPTFFLNLPKHVESLVPEILEKYSRIDTDKFLNIKNPNREDECKNIFLFPVNLLKNFVL